jgi:uridine kinase
MDDDALAPADRGGVRVQQFVQLAAEALARRPVCGSVRLVAVDGPGGAGKSTFAARLAIALAGAPVVHTDDFAGWDNEFGWYPRLLSQVVEPLSQGRPGRYQRYDWARRDLAEWHDVPLGPVVIVEGVGAARREFAPFLSLAVWIETPAPLRLARGLERDGTDMLGFWQQWIAGENEHFAADRPRDRADLVVDGDPALPHDPETQFIALLPGVS